MPLGRNTRYLYDAGIRAVGKAGPAPAKRMR